MQDHWSSGVEKPFIGYNYVAVKTTNWRGGVFCTRVYTKSSTDEGVVDGWMRDEVVQELGNGRCCCCHGKVC